MKYVKKITPEEWNAAFKKSYGILSKEEFWEIRCANANKDCACYATIDDTCFYYYDTINNNFVYFALIKTIKNIKGLYEVILNLVLDGIPYIYFNGVKGRYNIIKKGFLYVFDDERYVQNNEERDYFYVYAAHPANIERLLKRIK